MINLEQIADDAEVILCGYAFSRCQDGIRVFNLKNKKSAAVFTKEGILIETNMDGIELAIARDYLLRSIKYMED